MFKIPKDDKKYSWTRHVIEKMQHYGISEGRVKRIVRFPKRTEEGIAPNTVAVMQPAGSMRYSEIWVMYRVARPRAQDKKMFTNVPKELAALGDAFGGRRIRVITAWRYPGKSPERDPVPEEIMGEIKSIL